MCKKYPGPRCSACTRETLKEAIEIAEADPTPENIQKRKDAQYAFNTSPDGIKALQESKNPQDHVDAEFFQMVRKQQVDHMKAEEAKERAAMQGELEGLYSPHGIEEVRAMGDDDLADRLEERGRRAEARKGNEAGVVHKTDFTKPQEETPEVADVKKRSIAADAWDGAVDGAVAGWKNPKQSILVAGKRGYSVGQRSAAETEAQEVAQAREQEKITLTQEREAERATKAFEREQARLAREQERLEKVDLAWHNKLEADCIRYIKAQQREAVKRSKAKHTKPATAPKTKKAPQPQAA
jgi:hypothetical protein